MKNLFDRAKLFFSKDREFRSALYAIMGFYPHNIDLYRTAFAHKSQEYRSKRLGNKPLNNERLEFLGDAVLETVVSDIVYRHFPNKREGFLTNTRSKIVSRESLGQLAKELGIDRLIQSQTNSRSAKSYLPGNTFEALMGAIYLDRGFRYAYQFVEQRIIGAALDLKEVAEKEVNFKSKLLEWCQKNKIRMDFKEKGGEGNDLFHTTIVIEGLYAGDGRGVSKKESHQSAAKEALTRMRREADFIDQIFRSKEKRTAMEANEVFCLPKIAEIEDEIAKEGNTPRKERPKRERKEQDEKREAKAEPKTEKKVEKKVEKKAEKKAEKATKRERNEQPKDEVQKPQEAVTQEERPKRERKERPAVKKHEEAPKPLLVEEAVDRVSESSLAPRPSAPQVANVEEVAMAPKVAAAVQTAVAMPTAESPEQVEGTAQVETTAPDQPVEGTIASVLSENKETTTCSQPAEARMLPEAHPLVEDLTATEQVSAPQRAENKRSHRKPAARQQVVEDELSSVALPAETDAPDSLAVRVESQESEPIQEALVETPQSIEVEVTKEAAASIGEAPQQIEVEAATEVAAPIVEAVAVEEEPVAAVAQSAATASTTSSEPRRKMKLAYPWPVLVEEGEEDSIVESVALEAPAVAESAPSVERPLPELKDDAQVIEEVATSEEETATTIVQDGLEASALSHSETAEANEKPRRGRRAGTRQNAADYTNTILPPAEQSHRPEKHERRQQAIREQKAIERARKLLDNVDSEDLMDDATPSEVAELATAENQATSSTERAERNNRRRRAPRRGGAKKKGNGSSQPEQNTQE